MRCKEIQLGVQCTSGGRVVWRNRQLLQCIPGLLTPLTQVPVTLVC
jgi:hypothetical protein